MTNWTKIEPGAGKAGRKSAYDFPRVYNHKAGAATLKIPASYGFNAGEMLDVFTDAADAIAFVRGGDSYKVVAGTNGSPTTSVAIPAALRPRLPRGVTRCKLSVIDNGVILDLSQFAPKAAPAARDASNPFAPRAFAAE